MKVQLKIISDWTHDWIQNIFYLRINSGSYMHKNVGSECSSDHHLSYFGCIFMNNEEQKRENLMAFIYFILLCY